METKSHHQKNIQTPNFNLCLFNKLTLTEVYLQIDVLSPVLLSTGTPFLLDVNPFYLEMLHYA